MNRLLIARILIALAGAAGVTLSEGEAEQFGSALAVVLSIVWELYARWQARQAKPDIPVQKLVHLHERAERKKVGKNIQ